MVVMFLHATGVLFLSYMLQLAHFICVSVAACTNHVPVITTLLRGGETTVEMFVFVCTCCSVSVIGERFVS